MNFIESIKQSLDDRRNQCGDGRVLVRHSDLRELVRQYEDMDARFRAEHLMQEGNPMACRQRLHAVIQDAYRQLGAEEVLLDVAAAIKPLADEKRKREISLRGLMR